MAEQSSRDQNITIQGLFDHNNLKFYFSYASCKGNS